MKHLSEERLVELLEGGAAEADHLERCTACRERFDALRRTLGVLRDDPIPEPSPLFWQHLSERVRLAIDAELLETQPAERSVRSWGLRRWPWAAAGALAVLLAVLVVVDSDRGEQADSGADRVASVASPAADAPQDLSWSTPADDSWAMVAGLAEGLDLESAADVGLVVRPGSIDQALWRLSDEERQDLAGIIQAELDRSSL
ncbi:MAG: hypothetical protein ACRD1Q_00520 [Vicinamibacterales bacterium]